MGPLRSLTLEVERNFQKDGRQVFILCTHTMLTPVTCHWCLGSRQEGTFILLSSCMCLLKPLELYVAQNKNTVGFIVLGILNHLLLLASVLQQAAKKSVLARGFRCPPETHRCLLLQPQGGRRITAGWWGPHA